MRYSLLRAFKTVVKVESHDLRIQTFENICGRNYSVRLVFQLHQFLRNTPLAGWMVALFALKEFLSVGISPAGTHSKILATAYFAGEKRQLRWITSCCPPGLIACASITRAHIPAKSSGRAGWRAFGSWRELSRIVRISQRASKRYHFMPACRGVSAIAFALRFGIDLQELQAKAVLITSNYGPDAVGLQVAAAARGLPAIYAPHAYPSPRLIQPFRSELNLLQGEIVLERACSLSAVPGKSIFIGIQGNSAPLRVPCLSAPGTRFGIFLSGEPEIQELESLVTQLLAVFQNSLITIRPHPVSLITPHFPRSLTINPKVDLRQNEPLEECVQRCDVVIAGGSGVHLDVLKMGVPSLFYRRFERTLGDHMGFVAEGMVKEIFSVNEISEELFTEFYDVQWRDRLRRYDASYLRSVEEINSGVRNAVLDFLATLEGTASACA